MRWRLPFAKMAFNKQLISLTADCNGAMKVGWKLARKTLLYMPLQKFKQVRAASERQYTAAGGEVKIHRGGIYEWWKVERGDWYTNWWSKWSSARALSLFGHKQELSNTAKSVFVPILTYCMIRNLRKWLKTCKPREERQRWNFEESTGATLHEKVRNYWIRKALNVESLHLRMERSQLRLFRHVARMSQKSWARWNM